MLCPVCRGSNIKVLDSRDSRDGGAIRRRRSCPDCGHRFTTYERIEISLPVVIKRGGGKQAFDRQRLLAAIKLACRKRPIEDDAIDAVVGQVEQWAATRGEREIQAEELAERVMHHLHGLDPVAHVRFVATYGTYAGVPEFVLALQEREKAAQVSPDGQRTLFEVDARGQYQVAVANPVVDPDDPTAGDPADEGGDAG